MGLDAGDRTDSLEPRCKVWLEVGGHVALSDWRVRLLETIDACGSLAEAARQLDVPYRTAWYKLKEVEKALGFKVMATRTGGAARGGASLTEAGRDAVRRYHEVADGLDRQVSARFKSAFADLLPPPRET